MHCAGRTRDDVKCGVHSSRSAPGPESRGQWFQRVSPVSTRELRTLTGSRKLGQGPASRVGGTHQGQQELKSLSDRVRTGRRMGGPRDVARSWLGVRDPGPPLWALTLRLGEAQLLGPPICSGKGEGRQVASRRNHLACAPHFPGAGCPRGV